MATSNFYNFTVTRDQLITDAHQYIGAIGEGESPSTAQITEAARLLNMLCKLRAADGMPLWAMKRAMILPVTGTSSINTTSHVVTAYDETTIGAAEASGQTIISVTSSALMTAGDQVGIEQDGGTMHWTTISTVDSATQITIAAALTAASGAGNRILSYTASTERIPTRPLRVVSANMLELTNDTSWSLEIVSQQDYFDLANRTSTGVPNQLYYDATLGSDVADPSTAASWFGTFYFYPRFNDGDHVIEFTYQRPFQDFDASTDNPEFPQEFYLPLMLELASLLGPKYGVPIEERSALKAEAKVYRDEALMTIAPEGSLELQPDTRGRY